MEEKLYKYAELLLKKGLSIKSGQPLLIYASVENISFVRIVSEVALKLGVNDIYFDFCDSKLEELELTYLNISDIKKSLFWDKSVYNEYAKKNSAFLFLLGEQYNLNDISPEKMKAASKRKIETKDIYWKMQEDNLIQWCIGAVATNEWANKIFNNNLNEVNRLWNIIFDICLINNDNPIEEWNKKINLTNERCNILNKLNIKTLHYTNSLGTDLYIELSFGNNWCGGTSIVSGKEILVNIPTEEVFTTPNKYMTHGRVYSNIPLVHQGIIIKDIYLKFDNGRVVDYNASSGKDELKNIITMDDESSMLGEVALVEDNSPISNSNILFYETLYDENAACHIALGRGFKECLANGFNLSEAELQRSGYNKSDNHVDIMIGTSDMIIDAITYDDKEVRIFNDGNFVI